eukprot:9622012-Karenia_brevis.AAC.1
MHKFRSKGAPKWRSALLQLSHDYNNNQPLANFAPTYNTLSHCVSSFFKCPHGHPREATQQTFSVTAPSKAVWCASCKHTWGGRKWVCACGKSWAECPVHYNSIPVGVRSKKRKPMQLPPPTADIHTSNAKRTRIDIHQHAADRL